MNLSSSEDRSGISQRPITIIAIVTAFCLLGDSMLYIVLPIYWKEAGLNALWEVGFLLSINRFIRLPMTPLIGMLYKRMSLRTGLVFAILLAVVTTIGYGVCKGFILWTILRCIWGISWSFLRMGGFLSIIRYSDDSNRGRLMGRYNGISRLGSLVGMLLGGILVPLVGMDSVSVAFGLVMLAGLPYVAIYIKGNRSDEADSSVLDKERWDKPKAIWTRAVISIITTGLIVYLIQTILSATLSLVIETNYSSQLLLIGFVVTSTMLSGVLQAARWGWEPFLAIWIGLRSDGPRGRLPLFGLALLGAAVGYALVPWQLPIYWWCIVILFIMVTSTVLSTLMDALASDVARQSSAIAVMTAYSVATDLGSALGPLLIYLLIGLPDGLKYIYLGSALLLLLIAVWHRPGSKPGNTALRNEKKHVKQEKGEVEGA
ncbi:MFS transporter [Paenibacillus sp. 5J-6]|uniref:MFS transporter n=1 Tax=Paenibacillus silvestris TaxID=2606219 RepID=A0A6L8V1V3_9BACL|nr:MFS transporter [Paenibacillus silvestris]MZQ83210.1 MFS transporter [Paenibacillus silvestris]